MTATVKYNACIGGIYEAKNRKTVLIVISPFLLLTTRMCSAGAFKIHTDTHTHTFNGHFSGTTRVGRYQKSKTNLDFTEARDIEWQWHQLGHMQVCNLLQTDNHTRTPPLCSFTCRMPFLPPNQQRQSTEGKCGFHNSTAHTFNGSLSGIPG